MESTFSTHSGPGATLRKLVISKLGDGIFCLIVSTAMQSLPNARGAMSKSGAAKAVEAALLAHWIAVMAIGGCWPDFAVANERVDDGLQRYEASITHKSISEGEFWGLRIGDSKDEIIAQLKALDIHVIVPQWATRGIDIRAIKEDELHALQTAHSWHFAHDNKEGHWSIELRFKEQVLSEIAVEQSPFEGL